jgi:hypothetical protein
MGQEHNPAVVQLVQHEPVQANDDLHVLAHGAHSLSYILIDQPVPKKWGEIPTRPDDGVLLEHRKHPAQDQDGMHPIEAGPCRGEGTEILDHLKPG